MNSGIEMSSAYIQCGFQRIDLSYFRGKSLSKGKKLFESRHITEVQEILHSDGQRVIIGKVIPQTKVTNSLYNVKVELTGDRTIFKSHCSCKAGLSIRGCKHIAAVCIFINNESTQSKTDRPQLWNQPGKSQIEKYKKGRTTQDLFPSDEQLIDCNISYKFHQLENLPNAMLDIDCLFSRYVKAEKDFEPRRKIAMEEEAMRKQAILRIIEKIYNLQQSRTNYSSYEVYSTDNLKMLIKKFKCPADVEKKYNENIVVAENECVEICAKSISQSDCFEWFQERAKRITCSSKAHRIKTRIDGFETLASQFKKEKFDGRMTEGMKYGIDMEPVARDCFCALTGLEVNSVGLIISVHQPFLATSPDGIIMSEGTLLEIKCPFSCKDKYIMNRDEKVSNVPYLTIDDDNNCTLKKNHQYYTQVQVSMYILNMKRCHFFIFSANDNVHIIIEREDDFLIELIPKIELFYFKYFLPILF